MGKVMIIDLFICNGCHTCQIACKDEHVGNDWAPIAKPQPDTGQFWNKVVNLERGTFPKVQVTYHHTICQHCDDAPCITACNENAIYNDRGTVLAGAYITQRIIQGAIGIDHGAKYDPVEVGVIDRGGAINTIVPRGITSKNACGHAVSGFLAEVEKADLEELVAKYPEAFSRECHITAGPCLAGFTESSDKGSL